MQVRSKYDGKGLLKFGRPMVNLVIVLDISGSMGSQLSDDESISKLEAAKKCCVEAINKLTNKDRIGIIIFNQDSQIINHLEFLKNKNNLIKKINNLRANGMTNLSGAIEKGRNLFNNKILENFRKNK